MPFWDKTRGQLGLAPCERLAPHLLPSSSPPVSLFPFPSFLFLFSASVNDRYDFNIDDERARRRFGILI
jgi:hypothetical protein